MNIAFAALQDARDVRRGSGTWYHLTKSLEKLGHKLAYLEPPRLHEGWLTKTLRITARLRGRRYATYLDPFVGAHTGKLIAGMLACTDYDLVLTNDICIAAFTKTPKPLVLYTDVMITPEYTEGTLPHCWLGKFDSISLYLFRCSIRKALKNSTLCVFPAQWALEAALAYQGNAESLAVVPFGANVPDPGAEPQARKAARVGLPGSPLRLLWIGKDWNLKGGDVAVDTTTLLRRRGVQATLDVVGAVPPRAVDPSCIVVHGTLDKSDPTHSERLHRLLDSADVFVLPSYREGFVISVLEAAAYGLPTVAYDATGVNGAVLDDRTGILLELGARAERFSEALQSLITKPGLYQKLSEGARSHYEQSVNWSCATGKLVGLIEQKLRFGHLRSRN